MGGITVGPTTGGGEQVSGEGLLAWHGRCFGSHQSPIGGPVVPARGTSVYYPIADGATDAIGVANREFPSMDLNAPGASAPALLERMRQMRSRAGEDGVSDAHRAAGSRISAAPLPASIEDTATLLDVCFFATLLEEEGRPTRFAASFIGPGDNGVSARRLANPLPFTPESIKRLAPAADPELSSLAVWRTAHGLSIWGLLDVPRLHCLQIFGSDTGQLRVSYLGQTQMTHAHGRGRVRREEDPSFITSIQLIAAAMGLVTPQWYRPRALLGLADALIQTGHGGAILVSRRPAEEVRRHRIALTYPSLGPLRTLEEPVLEAQKAAPDASPDSEPLAHFKSIERQRDIYRSARLGAVDGGVLVDPHLKIMGFGAMIDVKGMRGSGRVFVVDLPAAMPHLSEAPADLSRVSARVEVPVEQIGGQRHQSAVRWCSASKAALLALVCSQDGAGSLIAPIGTTGDVGIVNNVETSPENW